jgi:hypothetical protein
MAYRNRSIPESDKDVRRFVYGFSRAVAADPGAFGFDEEDAALLVGLADDLIEKMVVATRPATRTAPAIGAKNESRKRVLAVFRSYVREVKANPSIESPQLVGVGIVADGRGRKSPLPPPVRPPTLFITEAGSATHRLAYWTSRQDEVVHRRGKPRGASHLVLLCHVGDRATGNPAEARYVGAFTRYPIRISHRMEDAGKVATYFGAWLTPSGKQSGWSTGASMTIAVAGIGASGPARGALKVAA